MRTLQLPQSLTSTIFDQITGPTSRGAAPLAWRPNLQSPCQWGCRMMAQIQPTQSPLDPAAVRRSLPAYPGRRGGPPPAPLTRDDSAARGRACHPPLPNASNPTEDASAGFAHRANDHRANPAPGEASPGPFGARGRAGPRGEGPRGGLYYNYNYIIFLGGARGRARIQPCPGLPAIPWPDACVRRIRPWNGSGACPRVKNYAQL
jgi:hypothetical protein